MNYTIYVVDPPDDPASTYSYYSVRLFEAALRDLGHDVRITTRKLASRRHNIVVNAHKLTGDMAPRIAAHDCTLLQTEMLTGGWLTERALTKNYIPVLSAAKRVWEWVDMRNVADLGTWGIERATLLLPGLHEDLRTIRRASPWNQDIDVVFMGSLTPHRQQVLERLLKAGLTLAHIVPGHYRPERANLLARAKCMLCPTDGPLKYFTSARVAYAVTNHIPCVLERPIHNPWPGCAVEVDTEDIVNACRVGAMVDHQVALAKVPHFTQNLMEALDA